ncbi:MAG: ATP-binding cassette domain-containing protein [Alphaproteobacteria bacterium]|nr:ATP-binding cassette domain-containing protein [Alphaproteobacteria bacterium]
MDEHKLAQLYHRRRSRTLAVGERIIRGFLRPYVAILVFATLANVVIAISTGALPWLIQQMIDHVFVERDKTMLVLVPIAIIIISFIRAGATYTSNIAMSYVGQKALAAMQLNIIRNLIHSDIASVYQRHTGDYISIFMTDVVRVRDNIINTVITLARNVLTVVALTVFMFAINWGMAMTYTLIVIPGALIMMRRLGKVTRKSSRKGLEETSHLSTYLSEMLHGLRIVKSYGQEDRQLKRAAVVINNVLHHTMKSVRARAASSPTVEMLAGIAIGVLAFYGGYQSLENNFTAGAFIGFITALLASYQPLRAVATLQTGLQEGVAAATRIFTILDQPRLVEDAPDAPALYIKEGRIVFRGVVFQYKERDIPALNGIDLEIAPGQTVALVGASGSGKSSLVNALLRFFDVDSGTIEIDGQNIVSCSLASLRQATGLVTQDPFLFDETIAINIAYGDPDASRADIESAAQAAGAHDFIMQLPEGYNTRVGESGMRLSGGQKQRLAIARAVLRNPPILLLDEATSALDTTTEIQVQDALAALMRGRSALVVAHRLSTIINADKICVMAEGRIVESGDHNTLLAQNGIYTDLYNNQFAPTKR